MYSSYTEFLNLSEKGTHPKVPLSSISTPPLFAASLIFPFLGSITRNQPSMLSSFLDSFLPPHLIHSPCLVDLIS